MIKQQDSSDFLVETHSIDYIPAKMRHGKPSGLFFLWFSANAEIVVVVSGMIVVAHGLSIFWTILGILLGTLVGSAIMALHSAQGPHLGIPQMIQSRAQFGFYGAAIPLVLVVLMYLGYIAVCGVIGGEDFARLLHISLAGGIMVQTLAIFLLVVAGYNIIHTFNRIMSYLSTAAFLTITIILIATPAPTSITGIPGPHAGFLIGPFLLAVSVSAINTMTYVPFVADYSRYLPKSTTISSAFKYTFGGMALSTLWMMIIGVILEFQDPGNNPVHQIVMIADRATPLLIPILLLIIGLGVVSINAMNLYGGTMSSITIATTFWKKWSATFKMRLTFVVGVALIGTYLTFIAQTNLFQNYETFLTLLIDLLGPWTAINLADFYWVRHGRYNIDAIYSPHG
ncbi:MAG: cytosine permease, partial [Firmicutes bacterium]|nr:cytosine permease [Bacillota bacterium]